MAATFDSVDGPDLNSSEEVPDNCAPGASAAPAPEPAPLLQPLPAPLVSYGLATACVLVYLAQVLSGVDWLNPAPGKLVSWGANLASHTLLGEPWRLLTSMFLHVGIIHLALNMYMLVRFGPVVESWFGRTRFALVYLISGLGGSLASALYHAQGGTLVVAAGASGALMGIAGALLGYSLVASARGDDYETISMRGPLAQTIGINLLIGLILPGVDNACHIGGLLAGGALGVALTLAEFEQHRLRRWCATAIISACGLLLVNAGLQMQPSPGLRALQAARSAEQVRESRARQRALQAAALAAEIARDRKNLPAPVSLEEAAGQWLELGGAAIQVGPGGQRIYAAGGSDNRLSVLAADGARLLQTIPVGPPCRNCGSGAAGFALDRAEHRAYVVVRTASNSMAQEGVAVIDLRKGRLLGTIRTGAPAQALVLAERRARAYAVGSEIAVIDLAAGRVVARAPTGAMAGEPGAARAWLAAGERELWTWNGAAPGLRVFDAGSLRELATLPLTMKTVRTVEVSARLGSAWALGEDRLEVLDLARRQVAARIALCRPLGPATLAVSDDGQLMAVAERESGFVRVVKMRTLQTLGVYPLKGEADALRFGPDGRHLYALSADAGGMAVFELARSASIAQLTAEWPDFFCTGLHARMAEALLR